MCSCPLGPCHNHHTHFRLDLSTDGQVFKTHHSLLDTHIPPALSPTPSRYHCH